jgi:hypothetical protein
MQQPAPQPARLPFPSKPRTPRPPCQVTLSLQSSLDETTTHCPLHRSMPGDVDDDGPYFFSAPASPVHYILRSPPSSTAAGAASPAASADADCCAAAAGDFEFAAHMADGPGPKGGAAMSSAEELFVAGRIRVGCLSPIRRQEAGREGGSGSGGGEEEEEEAERDRRSPRATRRTRSVSPTRSPRGAAFAEPSDTFTSASPSSSSSSSSSSAKNSRRRISLRDLLSRTGGDCAGAADQASSSLVRHRERRGHQQAGFLAAVYLAIAALVVQELAAALPGATAARPPLRLIGQGRGSGRRRQCSAHHVAAVPAEPGSRVPGLRGSQPELRGSPSPCTPSSLHAEHEKLANEGRRRGV